MNPPRDPLSRALLAAGLVAGLATLVAGGVGLGSLALDVRKQIEVLANANADSGHWSLAQADVELLALLVALKHARADPEALPEVRRRFDVFLGRVGLLRSGQVWFDLDKSDGAREGLDGIDRLLNRWVPLIDGPDSELVVGLAALEQDITATRPLMRDISLRGQRVLAQQSDLRREAAGNTLTRIAMLAAAMGAGLVGMVATLAILTRRARRRAEDQAHTRARLQAIISTSLDAVLVVDHNRRILDYNGAAQALFGHPVAMATGRDVADLVALPHDGAGGLPPAGAGLTRVEGIRRDGSRFPAECSVARVASAEGEVDVCFLRDISDRLAAEDALVQARDRALAGEKAKAEMLAVMSHEMRTPLNGLLGTAELLADTRLTQRQRSLLDTMRSSGAQLTRHVNDVLDLSRLDAGMMTVAEVPFDVETLLAEIGASQRPLAEAQGNRLVVLQPRGGLGIVLGDAQKLRQILFNLIGNAVKFTRDGAITLTARPLPDGWIAFDVQDTGIGIAPEDLLRIFDDFVTLDSSYSRHAAGTGLGLPIAQRMARAMGGRIEVESAAGQGSLFRVVLPLPPAPPAAPPPEDEPAQPAALAPLKVLVVEDNPVNRMVLREMLSGDGHHVTEAADGADGVAKAQEMRHDLILMDISMPGLDGIAATRAIRQGGGPSRDVPVLALTAHALPSDLERFGKAGMTATLTKPLTRAALRAVLVEYGAPPVINPTQIADLAQGLGPAVLAHVLTRLTDETTAGLDRLRQAVESGAPGAELAPLAHRLAGSAALFGADQLHGALIALETGAAANERPHRIAALLDDVVRIWPATRAAITRHFDALSASPPPAKPAADETGAAEGSPLGDMATDEAKPMG